MTGRPKFFGFLAVVATSAFLLIAEMTPSADAGLLRRIFGGGAYSSCGGGGGGGGGGLQSYSSCGGGGGGGGLQYAPVQYQPVYQPNYYQQSGCPGGVCPPSSMGLSYQQTVPSGITLNPGERYVVGSLRISNTAETMRYNASAPASTQIASTKATNPAPKKEKPVQSNTESTGDSIILVSQKGCVPCEKGKALAEKSGVDYKVVSISENPVEVVKLWRGADKDLESFPAWVILRDGKPVDWRLEVITSENELREMVGLPPLTAVESKTMVASSTDEKLDQLQLAMLELIKETRATRESIETAIKVSQK